eukprot:6492504-Amphidinium_carterae.4
MEKTLNSEEHCGITSVDVPTTTRHTLRNKELTRAVQKPNQHDKANAKHLLKYLHGTRNHKLHLRPKRPTHNEPYIKTYCDSDWAGCSTTRKSMT